MEKPFTGKTALITGAYRNLGSVVSETFARLGANVILNDIDSPSLQKVGEDLSRRIMAYQVKVMNIPADLSDSAKVRGLCNKALEEFGQVDILLHIAGPFSMDPFLQMKEQTYDLVMDVNVKAIYLAAQELVPQMKKNGWGRVVCISAGSAYVRNHSVYSLAKHAVQFITEELALELGPEVTINAIAPGQIFESLPDIHEFDPTFGERYTNRSPLKKLVTRQEVADLIAQICMPSMNKLTGVTIRFDAGAEIWRF
jgi:NAD(P)-dependent dehydrogenase (short-subunit alcohol dehydrogenase family)